MCFLKSFLTIYIHTYILFAYAAEQQLGPDWELMREGQKDGALIF